MPYTADWYIKNELIFATYSGAVTIDEMRESLLKLIAMIEESPRSLVHVIVDVGDVTETLAIKDSLSVVREVGTHDRIGWQITIREQSTLIKMGIAFGTTIFKTRTRAFNTMEEAIAFLKTIDEGLRWDEVNPTVLNQ